MNSRLIGGSLILVFVGLAVGLGACNQKRVRAVSLMNEGLKAQEHGQRGLAVDYLTQAMEKDPTYAKPAFYLAQIHHRGINSVEEAIPYYRKATNRDPSNAKYAYHLGTALLETNSPDQAIPYLKQAVNAKTQFAKAWLRLGQSQESTGQFESAANSFMRSIRANPELTMAEDEAGIGYHKLGQMYVRFGLFDKAVAVYENGLEVNPESLMLLHGRGVAELKRGELEAAVETFRKVVEEDPTRVSANFNLASALRKSGNNDQAIERLETFLGRANPQDHEARIRVARDLIDKWKKAK